MKRKLAILFLALTGSALAGGRIFVGLGVGGWGPVAPVVAYAPPPIAYPSPVVAAYPGPGYTWINGYYYPVGPRWVWRAGYWAPRPWAGAAWASPRWVGGRWYAGYWRR
jgi:WXXGXW repeat (2 copies)